MTKRIATGPFVLTLPTGEKKDFCAGQEIVGEHAEHWWVKAHSTEIDGKAEAARLAQETAEADERERLTEENAQLREANSRGSAENRQLRRDAEQYKADALQWRAEAERLRAESASTPPAADQKKKKDDKDPSAK